MHQRRAVAAWGGLRRGAARCARRRSCPPRASTASSIAAGAAPRSATSRAPPTTRASRASRRSRCWPTSPRNRCAPRPPPPPICCTRCRLSSPTCRSALRSARSCTGYWRRPTSLQRISTASSPRASPRCRRGARSTSATRRRWWRLAGGDRDAAGRRDAAARPRAHRPARRARLRVPARRRRRADRSPGARRDRGGATRASAARRPADRLRRRLGDPALRQAVRGFVTGSIDLVARAGGRLHGRRLQDELARRLRRGADRLASSPRRAGRRDGARALRAAGAALPRRAPPLPALATARLRPGRAPRWREVPVRARDGRRRHAGGRRRPAACSPGTRRPRW